MKPSLPAVREEDDADDRFRVIKKGQLARTKECAAVNMVASDPPPPPHLRSLVAWAIEAGRTGDALIFGRELIAARSRSGEVADEEERRLFVSALKQELNSLRTAIKLLSQDPKVICHDGLPTSSFHAAVTLYRRQLEEKLLALANDLLALAIGSGDDERGSEGDGQEKTATTSEPPPDQDRHRGVVGQVSVCEGQLMSLKDAVIAEGDEIKRRELVKRARSLASSCVFWYKLAADYCRYVCESYQSATHAAIVVARHSDLALSFYAKARSEGLVGKPAPFLPSNCRLNRASSSLILGVALNLGVFLAEVRDCREEAVDFCRQALEQADAERGETDDNDAIDPSSHDASVDASEEDTKKKEKREAAAVTRLIKENLLLWEAQLLEERREKELISK